jgi:predicted Ser/Thr protein kinase
MALTPSTIRLDLKCGKGAISEGEKCHVGTAKSVEEGQLSPRELKRASSKLTSRPTLKKRYVAIAAYAALTAATLYQARNIRQAYAQKFDPAERYTAYKGTIGDPATVIKQMQGSSKTGAPSLFGEVTFGKLDNKDIVVKRLGIKGMAGASQVTAMELQGIISSKTADALRRAQGSLQTNEVQGAELAGKLGFGPRVVAAGNNSLITEVAKGRPLSSQDRLARNGAKLQQELLQDPAPAIKKIAKLRWLGFTKGTEVSTVNKNRIIENMARMHTAGISHNDLHPGNIFISDRGAQFIDFGTSERGGGSVAAEFVRMMNPPRAGLQQNGGMGYNLRSVDPKGYAVTEKSLRQAIGKKVGQLTAADVHKAVETSKDRDALEKRLQSITDEYYRGYASRRPNWEAWRANAPKAGGTDEERKAFKSFFERNTPGLKRGDSLLPDYLTPALIRSDSKGRPCGQSHIASTKNCQKNGSFPSRKAIAVGLTASVLGAALLHKGSRKAILNSPRTLQRASQRGITEVVHRMTAKPPSMRLTPRAFEQIKPPSKTERLNQAARSANVNAEEAMRKAARAEIERGMAVGQAMYAAGKATRASLRSGMRTHNLTVEKLRRRYEPGYRRGRTDNYIQTYAPVQLQPPTRRDACWEGYVQAGMKRQGKREVPNCVPASSGLAKPQTQKDTEDGKKYTKTVTNPETGRPNKVRYGAKGYRIAPGTPKGDRYCARSFGDMKSEGYDCSGAQRNTPLCLSRAKWKCSGKTSRR